MTSTVGSSPTPPKVFSDHCKKGYGKFKKGVSFVVDQTGDGGTVNTVAKFARRFFDFLAAFAPIAAVFGPAGDFFKSFGEVYKILGVFKSGQDLLNAKKIRQAFVAALGISIAGLSLVKIFDSFKWVNLASISASFGKVAIIGAVAIVPLSVFISWLEILKASAEISISLSALVKTAKKVVHVNDKKRFWQSPIDQNKCNQRVRQYRKEGKALETVIASLEEKQAELQDKVDKWSKRQEPLDAAIAQKKLRLQTQNKMKKCCVKTFDLLRKIRPPKTTRKLNKWQKLNDKVSGVLEQTQDTHKKVSCKKLAWQRMGKRYDQHIPSANEARYKEDREKIDVMQGQKFARWNVKKSNIRLEQFKEVMSILVNGAVILLAVGGTVLFFVGIFSTPVGGLVIPILLPALGLAVATIGLGMHFFKRYKGKKSEKVEMPTLSTAKKWKKINAERKSQSSISNEESNESDHSLGELKRRRKKAKKASYNSSSIEQVA